MSGESDLLAVTIVGILTRTSVSEEAEEVCRMRYSCDTSEAPKHIAKLPYVLSVPSQHALILICQPSIFHKW